MLVERWLGLEIFSGQFWTILALTALLSTAIASLSWKLLEQPALRYLSGRRTARARKHTTSNAQ